MLGQNPTEDEIEDMIDETDEDGSGSINFPEFVGLMMKKQEGNISRDDIKQVNIKNIITVSKTGERVNSYIFFLKLNRHSEFSTRMVMGMCPARS